MKKSLLALAAIGFAGAVSAQSSVTLFGIVDAAYGHVSANGKSVSGISNSGINSSRLGFRGVEDLGGGLEGRFWLEGQLFNDVGQGSNATTGFNFLRRATVSLVGGFGEVRLGRDYVPTFWNTTVYDAFGTNGVAQSQTPGMLGTAGVTTVNNTRAVRADNAIGYFLPGNLGGFTGHFAYAFGENGAAATGAKANNYMGMRLGYAAGPFAANFATGKTKGATSAADVKYNNIGASFDVGIVKPMFVWAQEKAGSGAKVTGYEISLTAPLGQGELRAAYSRYDLANSSNDWNKFGLGYVYNLSKRTALYTQYARVSNKGAQVVTVTNNGLTTGIAAKPGGGSTGYEFGLRHSF